MSVLGFIQQQKIKLLADKSLKWLVKNVDSFRVRTESYEDFPWRIKPIAELLFVTTILTKHNVVTKEIKIIEQFILSNTKDFDWQELAAFDPSVATVLFALEEFYVAHNQKVPWEQGYGDLLNSSEYFEAIDRVPYRELEYLYCLESIGKHDDNQLIAEWFSNTTFGLNQPHIRYTINDMYSLTHAIFYITALGTKSIDDVLDAPTCERMRKSIVTLSVAIARGGNIDVLGELLLCWIWINAPLTKTHLVIFKQLLSHVALYQVDNGAIAPNMRVFQNAQSGNCNILSLYHTTMVATVLFHMVKEKL